MQVKLDLIEEKKNKSSACIYSTAAHNAMRTQGRAYCIALTKSYAKEAALVNTLNKFSDGKNLEFATPFNQFDPNIWEDCSAAIWPSAERARLGVTGVLPVITGGSSATWSPSASGGSTVITGGSSATWSPTGGASGSVSKTTATGERVPCDNNIATPTILTPANARAAFKPFTYPYRIRYRVPATVAKHDVSVQI